MKTLARIFLLFAAVILISCEGEPGPPGQDGLDGLIGSVFEIEGDFTPGNNYTLFYEFPNNFQIDNDDLVLVYILWEVSNSTDVWRLLPQTVVLEDGILQYNFDYTLGDVQIFLEGTTDFDNLLPAETDDQIFRIAVLPAEFAKNKSIDVTDFNAVAKSINVNLNSIQRTDISIRVN